jgi:iron complex transport system ATP-binding protein
LSVLEIKNLCAGYEKEILHNLNFSLSSTGLLAILGKNGSGKSTLIKCIAQQLPYSGSIIWNGSEMKHLSIKERAKVISYLHQRGSISLNISVLELVVMGRFRFKSHFEKYSSEDYQLAESWLEKFGINHLKEKAMQDISGGEQQMVWICQAFIQDTPIILLDEPSSHLDLMNKRKIFDLVQNSISEKIIIIVTHDIEYLKSITGTLVNISDKYPELKSISAIEIDHQRELLESY